MFCACVTSRHVLWWMGFQKSWQQLFFKFFYFSNGCFIKCSDYCRVLCFCLSSLKWTFFPVFLAAVVLAFFLCWAPFHAQRLGYVYFKESKIFRTLNEYLYYISGFLYYLSATVNPILYNLMSLKYRHAFRQTLCTRKRRRFGNSTQANNRRQDGQFRTTYTFRSNSRAGTIFMWLLGTFPTTIIHLGMTASECGFAGKLSGASCNNENNQFRYDL